MLGARSCPELKVFTSVTVLSYSLALVFAICYPAKWEYQHSRMTETKYLKYLNSREILFICLYSATMNNCQRLLLIANQKSD